MAITLTPRLGLTQWGQGSDPPGRAAFNTVFARIDAAAATDDGAAGGAALPTTGVNGQPLADGRYAQTVDGTYRRLFRRAGGAWAQVGGNTWSETVYNRADPGAAVGAEARQISHPNLANPGLRENWDGSSVRGGRQAIGDVNAAQPGALHVGDTASAVDLPVRGRLYARTTAAGQRGIVASAHAADAGNLFSAIEPGGGVPWYVDPQGRMRSQVPSAFGAAAFTAGVPIGSAPGAADVTAADLFAAAGKPALRLFRAVGDATPIGLVEQDKITLGRSTWTNGVVELRAPTLSLIGAVGVTGDTAVGKLAASGAVTLASTLGVTGKSTLGVVEAGAVTATSMAATNAVTAHGGKVTTTAEGTEATVRAAVITTGGTVRPQSVRQSVLSRKVLTDIADPLYGSNRTFDFTIHMPEDGWMRLYAELLLTADLGASNTLETAQLYYDFDLRNAAGTSSLSRIAYGYVATVTTDDSPRQIPGRGVFPTEEVFLPFLTEGTYTLRMTYSYSSILVPHIDRLRVLVEAVTLQNNSGSQ